MAGEREDFFIIKT